jgi:hypothetical protein
VPLEQLALHQLGREIRAAQAAAAGDEHAAAGAEAVEAEDRLAPHDWLLCTGAGLELLELLELWSLELEPESSLKPKESVEDESLEDESLAAEDDALVVVLLDRAGSWPWTICT